MPTLEPRFAGFTNIGYPRSLLEVGERSRRGARVPVVRRGRRVGADRQAVRGEDDLHHPLVHADRGGEHAGADVGDVGQLEQPLDRAVLAVGAVQHREDDVEVQAR